MGRAEDVPLRGQKRSAVRQRMAEVYAPDLSDAQVDAMIDHVWQHSGGVESEYDRLMDLLVKGQATWWGTQATRSG